MLMFSCTNKAEMAEFERDLEAVSPHLRKGADKLRSEVNSELNFPPNFEGLVLGCIDADFCK